MSGAGLFGFAAARALELGARSRLVIARDIEGRGFSFDEGRAGLLLLAFAILALTSLQAYFRRRARAAAAAHEAAITARSPRAEPTPSARSFKSRDAVLDPTQARPAGRPDEGTVVRCPKCYGKYHVEREPRCPHCGADRPGAPTETAPPASTSKTAAEVRRDLGDTAATRFQDAERLNDEGIEILRKIRSVFRVDDAVKKFTLAINRAPKNPTYYSNRGIAHLTNARRRYAAVGNLRDETVQRDVERARADFQEAIRLNPKHANFHYRLGQAEEFAEDLPRAQECFEQALALGPGDEVFGDALSRVTRDLEHTDVTSTREKVERLMTEVTRRASAGDLDGALQMVDLALESDGSPAAVLLAKADLLNRLNRVEESVEVARRAIEASNREIQNLVVSYQAKGLHALVLPTVGEGTELGLGTTASLTSASGGRAAAVSGSLTELGLPDLLQVLGAGQKTVRVTLKRGTAAGIVELEQGHIVHAELGSEMGEDAFYRIVAWSEGEFRIDPLIDVGTRTIHASNDALILEGLRQLDEALLAAQTRARPDA
jgi:tetratricopeptide (TPR) repeat protein